MKLSQGKFFIMVLILICCVFASYLLMPHSHVSRKLTEKDIPSNTPSDIARYIKMTLSDDPVLQVVGAKRLELLGKRAVPAIPFLIQLSSGQEYLRPEHFPEVSNLYELSNDFNPYLFGFNAFVTPMYQVTQALAAIGEPAFDELHKILIDKSANPSKRWLAVCVFREAFQPSMRESFVEILSDKNEDSAIKCALLDSLGEVDDPELFRVYANILKDNSESEMVRDNVLEQLMIHRCLHLDSAVIRVLHTILDSKDENDLTRERAGYVLAMHADDETLDYLTKKLEEKNEKGEICRYIAEGLGLNSLKKAKEIVLNMVNKYNGDIKKGMLLGMGKSKDPDYEDIIIQNADSGDIKEQMSVVNALYCYGSNKTINRLFSIVADSTKYEQVVQEKAAEFLAKMKNNEVTDRLFAVQSGSAQSSAECAHFALLQNLKKDEYLLQKWIDALNNKSLPIKYQRNAVTAIDVCNGDSEKGPHALAKAATDQDKDIRREVAFVLGRIGTPEEVPALEALAKDKEISVSNEAKEAIKKLNSAQ